MKTAVSKPTSSDLFSTVRGASRMLTQVFDKAVRPFGLRATQYDVLRSIQKLGCTTVQELAAEVLIDDTSISHSLRTLKSNGLISVEDGTDRRQRIIRLSRKGEDVVNTASPSWHAVESHFSSELGPDRILNVTHDMNSIAAAVSDYQTAT